MEGRIKHALKLCGPGAESDKQKDVDPINISRAGMGLPANFGPRPQHIGKLCIVLQGKSEAHVVKVIHCTKMFSHVKLSTCKPADKMPNYHHKPKNLVKLQTQCFFNLKASSFIFLFSFSERICKLQSVQTSLIKFKF